MLKVNKEKILNDYKELVEKKAQNLAAIEVDAKAYAAAHGYNEDKTAKFVAFTQEIQGNGLSDDENATLVILSSYLKEVEEPVAEEEVAEATPVDAINAVGVTVNNI